jgi:transposase
MEEKIEQDNPVRIIDAFVDSCKLEEFGFTHAKHAPEGRPPYYPGDLLKLYIYGYLNRIRTSRMLEKECKRNMELMWLLKELTPDHNTIANFRKENPKTIKMVFRRMVNMCKRRYLIGGKVIAIDGTKLRAQNSTSVDAKHYLPIDFKTTNNNDTHALGNMTARTKSILGHNDFTALLDKGYHTGSEISRCHEMGVETMVAIPALSTQAVDPAYNVDQFIYHKETDTY